MSETGNALFFDRLKLLNNDNSRVMSASSTAIITVARDSHTPPPILKAMHSMLLPTTANDWTRGRRSSPQRKRIRIRGAAHLSFGRLSSLSLVVVLLGSIALSQLSMSCAAASSSNFCRNKYCCYYFSVEPPSQQLGGMMVPARKFVTALILPPISSSQLGRSPLAASSLLTAFSTPPLVPPATTLTTMALQRTMQKNGFSPLAAARGTARGSSIGSISVTATSRSTARRTYSTALHVKCKSFDEMLSTHGGVPLLIDFYASWCGPCKMMKAELCSIRPQLEKLGPMRVESLPVDDDDDDERGEDAKDDGPVRDSEDGAVTDTADGASRESENAGTNDEENSGANNNTRQQPTGIPVYHVNTNKFPQVGARNKIGGLPTLVLFLDGEEIWRNEGFMLGKDVLDVLTRLQEDGCWGENG